MVRSVRVPSYRFRLEAQKPKTGNGGSAKEASIKQFPVSVGIAGVSMRLGPGTLRELHWHANAAEWAYVVTGQCRTTVFDPAGTWETLDFGPGDVWYFPRGHGHSIQGLGPGDCHFILVFDNGAFSEFATFSVTDWVARTPAEVLAKTLHVPAHTFRPFPKEEVYFAKGPEPGLLPMASGSVSEPSLPHQYRLRAQTPQVFNGGNVRIVSSREFPISTTITGALMSLDPGALREPHWHPNADEWQYVLSGRYRQTVFASSGRSTTIEYSPGDVGYVPRGFGHYLESVGRERAEILLAFNTGVYEEIGLAEWLASNPHQLVATNFGISPYVIKRFARRSFIAPSR